MGKKFFKQLMSIITVIIFGTMICVPLFHMNREQISKLENKKLAKLPVSGGEGITSYIAAFNDYIDDNIGFKDQIIMLRLNLMYRLFHNIDSSNYIMGKNEHLFYTANGKMISTFQGKDKVTIEQMERFYNALQGAKKAFEPTGGKFYVVGIPDKEQIYSEFYPDSIMRYTNTTKSEELINYIQQKDSNAMIYLKDKLLEAKQKQPEKLLYYKNFDSSHWNNIGAFVGYQAMMNHLKKDFPQLKVFSEEDIVFTSAKSEGLSSLFSQVKSLSKIYNFDDDIYYSKPKEGYKAVKLEEPVPEILGLPENSADGLPNYIHFVNESMPDAPKLLMMCDSYILMFLCPMISESFSETYFIHRSVAGKKFADFQKEIQADIVMVQFVDRVFSYEGYAAKIEQMQNNT